MVVNIAFLVVDYVSDITYYLGLQYISLDLKYTMLNINNLLVPHCKPWVIPGQTSHHLEMAKSIEDIDNVENDDFLAIAPM